MKIIRAAAMGMCFGVRDALAATQRVEQPVDVTIHGELVHNRHVQSNLSRRGFRVATEADRDSALPETQRVLITAHGVSQRKRKQLLDAGKTLIDTTCPLVHTVHDAAIALQREGRLVLLIGKPGHVEVRGVIEDLADYRVIERATDVQHYGTTKLGIVCQSTAAAGDVHAIRTEIAHHNPGADIRFIDTVCQPTKDRQLALDELCAQSDVVIVVGGRNSNNTARLAAACFARGVRAHHIEHAGQLDPEWLAHCHVVGLTAGTSTPDTIINEVHTALLRIAARSDAA